MSGLRQRGRIEREDPRVRDRRAADIPLPDGDLRFFPKLFSGTEGDAFLTALKDGIDWQQKEIRLFGRTMPSPRLTAWFGDPGTAYRYSGIRLAPTPWPPLLCEIKARVERVAGTTFNSVLLNRYRTERDGVAWHSDDERELGRNPVIGSVSFGAARTFQIRHKDDKSLKKDIELVHGSFLLMAGATQHHWEHRIPKRSAQLGERINLTFRRIENRGHA